jgi:subtilisin family serine protease
MSQEIISLPPFEVKHVVSTLSQVTDWGVKQSHVPQTWSITQGEGVRVMVIDTGFTDHRDLEGCTLADLSKSFVSSEPDIHDKNGHSSHCCGIIGARNNSTGMVGVAPKCEIITVKVLSESGSGSMSGIIQGLEYAKQIKPDVISMSLGSGQYHAGMHQLIKELKDMNIPIIAAAGNDGQSDAVNYPGKYSETICVTAFDKKGRPARFNSTGDTVDFSAPGVDIYSTYLKGRYAKLSGTSMATPFISGLVALLIAKHKKQEAETGENDCKTVDQIKEHLIKYSDDKGVVGRDDTWGYGVIDAEKLIIKHGEDPADEPTDGTDDPEDEPDKPTPQPPRKKSDNLFRKFSRWWKKIW